MLFASLLVPALIGGIAGAASAAEPSIRLSLDATGAPQKIYHVKETISGVKPGPFTFVYPKWIPGYHQAVGPIEGVVSLRVRSGGSLLEWRRDLVDTYAVHATLPDAATSVDVDFDVVGADSRMGNLEPVSTPWLAVLEFSNFVIYPQGSTAVGTAVDASVTLPAGWTLGTALPIASSSGATTTFARASLYTLIDSPIISGAYEKSYPLTANEELDVAGDDGASIAVKPKFLEGMKRLVAEAPILYGGRHYRDYHFLLTLSDSVGGEGIEHHESSDNRSGQAEYVSEDGKWELGSDLLPHEYSHSWNGKYRRPADLATADYQAPEQTDLLWVYEGLNQFNGEKLATRAHLNDFQIELDKLALTAASLDHERGRDWRPLRDTADGAPFLYSTPRGYYNIRRSAGDFYGEGDLIWLDADVTIRKLTGGTRSLDDFCKLWGNGSDTTDAPVFNPYDYATVIALMNSVVPYDWNAFFTSRVAKVDERAPLGGIEGGGYRLVYTSDPSKYEQRRNSDRHLVDAAYSIGFNLGKDGKIDDIATNSPAFAAGIAPGWQLIAVDGRKYSPEIFKNALRAHAGRSEPLSLIVTDGDQYKTVAVDGSLGLQYPHLERIPGTPDVLEHIFASRASGG